MFGSHILSNEPWMGQPPRVIDYDSSHKFMLICKDGHEEVSWRAEKAKDTCWICGKEQGSLLSI